MARKAAAGPARRWYAGASAESRRLASKSKPATVRVLSLRVHQPELIDKKGFAARCSSIGRRAKQPVAKVGLGLDGSSRAFYTAWHGDGQETGGAAGITDVGEHRGPSEEQRTSFLRAAEPDPGGVWFRRVRRRVVHGLLRGTAGPAGSAAGSVFPVAVHRLFRGCVVGARDRVAGGGFAESAVVSGPGRDGGGAGPLDAVADATADRRGDARGGVHVGAGAGVGGGSGAGEDGRHRCDDVGSERGDA